MKKYYYENSLANQNYIARPNVAWAADITSFELNQGKKVYVFFCVDVFSNKIVVSIFRTRPIQTNNIIKNLSKAIDKRLPIKPERELIIHTDRGTQFSSKTYNEFLEQKKGYVVASISRANTLKDNTVAERFMLTFKEHEIFGETFEQTVQESVTSAAKPYKSILNSFI